MNRTRLVMAVALVVLVGLGLPAAAQQSSGEGYDIEVYEVTSGLNSFNAVSGGQVTVRVRFTTNSSPSGDCGGTAVVPNSCASFGFQLSWDPTVLSYNSHSQLPGVPSGWSALVNTSNTGTGSIGMGAFGTSAATSPADVLEIVFDVVGGGGSSSALTFSNVVFGDTNGNDLCGTFNSPGNGSTGAGDYYDEQYDGLATVVAYGVTVTPTALTIPEGGNDTFTVVLNTQPSADVVINLASSDTSRATVSPASMTFTSTNWNTAQTATVTAVQDDIDNGDANVTIQTTLSTTDPNYSSIDPDDVAVTVQDDDTAGITVNPTSGLVTTEAGGTDSFTVVLDTEPTADVTIGLSSSDTSEGTVSPASMTFTAANWNVAQTATVTGVDDAVADGDQAYTIVTAAATSSDANYSGMDPADVAVTNTDDDSPGVTVTPTTVNVAEGGATDSYDVVLNTLPTADVTINITTGGQTTVNPTSLTFTSTNGTTPQTVTVTAVDDAVLEGDHTDTISHTATSGDPDYNNATISDVTANITDNEAAIWLSDDGETPAAGTAADDVVVHEEGATSDTIRVALPVGPTGDVNFTVTSDTQTTVSPTSFTLVDNNQIQDITVTAVDDAVYEGGPGTFHPSSITISASSTDPRFDGASANVTASVEDNEEAPAIPVLGGTGLVLLIGLLTGLGVAILRFRR